MKHFIRLLPAIALVVFMQTTAMAQIIVSPTDPANKQAAPDDSAAQTEATQNSPQQGAPARDRKDHTTLYLQQPMIDGSAFQTSCTDSSECAIVTPPCRQPIAVNRSQQQQIQQQYDTYTAAYGNRLNCAPQTTQYTAVCSAAHTCLLARPGLGGVPRADNPGYCETDNDCTVVTDACGRKKVMNATTAGNQPAPAASGSNCDYKDTTQVKSMQCKNHLCTMSLSNN